MSNRVLLKKSSIAAKVPLVADLEYGELALNYTDGKLYYKTANNTVASLSGDNYVQIDRKSYTATAAQTTFSIAYIPPYVDVYINGVHMSDEDYTATSGTSIVLTQACSVGDQVDLMGFSGTLISTSQKTNGEVLVYNGTTGIWDNVAQSTLIAGNATKWATPRNLSLTGDATATLSSVDGSAAVSAALTLATVNSNVGTFGSSTLVPVITVNAKGLVTGVTTSSISGALTFTGDVTGSGTTGSSTVLTIAPLAVTNAMLAGSITNAKLSNSSVTVGTTAIALGASSTTLAGLTSVTSTSFTGALTGNASTATTLETARAIQGVNFDGSAAITVVTAGTGVSVSGTAVSIGQAIGTTDNVTFNNVTVSGTLTSDDITSTNISVAGNATITGDLIVSGTTTTINSTVIAIADLNLELARNATTAVQANGAGLTVIGPTTSATFTYTSADDRWNLNKDLNVTTVYGALSGNASTATALATGRTIAITGDIAYTSGSFDGTSNVTGTATLATVNSNTGAFGSTTASPVITVNAKGLVTAVSTSTITPAIGSITGLGTGVATALGVNTGTAGAFVVNGGALGSPSTAGTMPAFTLGGTVSGGGNQINNVIIGTTTPLAGSFTTLTTSSTVTHNGGTANGVAYLNGSKVLTTGTALTFDGTTATTPRLAFGGTTLPSAGTATIFGRSSDNNLYLQAGSGNDILFLDGSQNTMLVLAPATLTFQISNVNKLTLNSTGLQVVNTLSGGTSGTGYSFSGSAPAGSLTLDSSGNLSVLSTGVPAQFSSSNASNTLVQQTNTSASRDLIYRFRQNAGAGNWYDLTMEGSTNAFTIDYNDNERLRIDSSGNLGIGTSSPATLLTINGNDPLITLKNAGTNRWQFGLENTSSNRFVFYDNTAAAYRLIIDSAGNVGIGNTAPTYKLDFAVSQSTGDAHQIRFGVNNGASGSGGGGVGSATGGNSTPGTGIVFAPNYTGYTKRSAGMLQVGEGNYFRSGLAFYVNNVTDSTTDWSEALRISSNSNVGIGTTSPTKRLEVKGTTTGSVIRASTTDGAGSSSFGYGFYVDNTAHEIATIVANYVSSGGAGYGGLTFNVANNGLSSAMTIDYTGKVGIGTSPVSLFHVAGGGIGTRGAIRISDSGGANYWEIGRDNATTGNFTVNLNATEFLRIDNTGSTSINSTTDGTFSLNKSSGSAWNYINFKVADTRKFYFGINASNEPELGTDNSTVFRVTGGMSIAGNTALHAGNYNSYSPTLTGGGASGTWGINITGTAGSETLATVTSRGATTTTPVTMSSFNDGYITFNAAQINRAGAQVELQFAGGSNSSVGIGAGGAKPIIFNANTGSGTFSGAISAATKSFLIPHPTKPGMQLRYGSLEGPENGVYVRGRLRGNKIELPEYWTKLVDPDSITVNLTAIGKPQELYVEDIIDNVVYIGGENVNCFYTVFAERVDVAKLEVEIQ